MQIKKFPKGLTANSAAYYAAVAETFSIAAVDQLVDNSTKITYFSSVALNYGSASPTRVLAAVIPSRQTTGYNNVASVVFSTTSGILAVRDVEGTINGVEIWYAAVPSGSSGVTTVTFSSNGQTRAAMQLYSIYAPATTGPSTTAVSTGVNQPLADMTIPAGGAAIAGGFSQGGGPTTIVGTPTGFDIVDLNSNITGAQILWSMHSSAGAVVGSTTLRMTLASSGGNTVAAAFASWGP